MPITLDDLYNLAAGKSDICAWRKAFKLNFGFWRPSIVIDVINANIDGEFAGWFGISNVPFLSAAMGSDAARGKLLERLGVQ